MIRRTSIVAAVIAVVTIGVAVVWTVGAASGRVREAAVAAASAALGREIAIGRLTGDPWRGVVLEDVRIGPRPGQRTGDDSFTARRLTLHFDPAALLRDLWHRRGISASISQIIIDEPVMPVVRQANGRWNTDGLLPSVAGPSGGGAFAGRLIVTDGTLTYIDRQRLAPQAFEARFEDLNGTADFSTPSLVRVRASFVEVRGDRRIPARARGTYTAPTHDLDIELEAHEADAGAWGPYFLTTPAFRIAGGRIDARMHVLRTQAGGDPVIDVQGRIRISQGRARIPDRSATLANIHGTISVANLSLSTDGLRGTVNGSPIEVRGDASLHGEPHVDLAVRSPAMNLDTLRRVLFPGSRVSITGIASGEVRVVGPITMPLIDGRVTSARGQFDQQPFAQAAGDFTVYGQLVRVSGARAQAGHARVAGDLWWTLDAPDYLVNLRFDDADRPAITRWIPGHLPEFTGRAAGVITAMRRGDALTVLGRAAVDHPRVAGLSLDRVEASFISDRHGIRLDRVQASQDAAWIFLHGRVDAAGRLALSAHAGAVDLTRLPSVPLHGMIDGRTDFAGQVRGTVDAPEISGSVFVSEGRLRDMAFDTTQGRIALRPGRLTLEEVTARSGRSRYSVAGQVEWGGRTRLALDIEARRAPATVLSRWLDLPVALSGSVDGRIRVEGPAEQPSVSGSALLRNGQAYGQAIDEAAVSFRWDSTRLVIDQGTARRRQSVIELSGTIDSRVGVNLDVTGRGVDLADLSFSRIGATRLEGRMDFSGRLAGPTTSPTVTATARSSTLTVNGRRFDGADGRVRWEGRTLSLETFALRLGTEQYDITGDIAFDSVPSTRLQATVANGRLVTLLGLANVTLGLPLDATIDGVATLDGPASNPAAHLDLRLSDGRFGTHRIVEGRADLTLRDGAVIIDEFSIRPTQGAIAARGQINLRGESQVELDGSELDLDLLRPLFRLRRPLHGQLNFTTQLGGTLVGPEIGFSLDLTKAGVEGVTFDSLVANAFYRDGLLQVQQALLVQNGNKLRASGVAPFNPALRRFDDQRPMDVRVALADVNLGLLRLFTDRIQEAVGAVEGEVRVTGSPAAPHVSGGVQVQGGRLRFARLETPMEALRVDLRFEENQIRIQEATASMGGLISVDGAMRLQTLSPSGLVLVAPEDAPLVIRGAGVHIVYPPFLDVRAAGQARLWGALGDARRPLTMDGRITVSDGRVSITDEGSGGPPAFPLVFRGLRLDAGRNLAVQIGGLRSEISAGGSLLLGGTLRAPTLEGTVEVQQGKIVALSNVFDLRRGTATFQPRQGIRPAIEALAETQVGTTRISLNIRGIPPDLVLDLRSDPDLSREEILALLGRQAGISRLLQGDVAGQLRAEIGRFLFGRATLALGRAIGLTELVIEYDFQGPLALRAGKLLLRDVYLTYSTILSQPPAWVLALEYRFAPNWQFTLGVDSQARRDAIFWYTVRF